MTEILKSEERAKITVGIPCDRCLEEVSTEIPLEIERKLDMKLTDEDRVNDLDESYLSHRYGPGCGPVGLS